ncbi:MAG: carboxypeptidase M32 [Clostridiales bacterium]|nr:carboxypeptidase M32 [Clostridiales bacterium]
MKKDQLLKQFDELEKKLYAYGHAMMLLNWDGSTFAPTKSVEGRSIASSVLAGEQHKILTRKETGDLINELRQTDDLDEVSQAKVNEFYRDYKKLTCIPEKEVMEFSKLRAQSESIWVEAKKNNDFASFVPSLEKLIDFTKRFAKYYDSEEKPYNTLLDDYQPGLKMETVDAFFAEVEKSLVPLNKFVASSQRLNEAKKIKERINAKGFAKEGQIKLIDRLFELQGLDPDRCKIAQSAHPFTSGANSNDIRYTVTYHEDNLAAGIFAAFHEGGHAMYQLNINGEYDYSSIYTGASMTMHESQSRIYENNMGRSKAFNPYIYEAVKKEFPKQMSDVSADDFYLYSNYSSPSFIRVEADELTYSLHVMIRYQIERMIFEENLPVAELPAIWNKKYEEYLGITPPTDTLGVLQDVHWSFGLFGYFATYSLGTAYSAQLEATMKEHIDYDGALKKGNLTEITKWLKENVQQYGRLYTDDKILNIATGKSFDPSYYTKYLNDKYREIYK